MTSKGGYMGQKIIYIYTHLYGGGMDIYPAEDINHFARQTNND